MSSTWLHLYVPGNPNHVFSSSVPPRSEERLAGGSGGGTADDGSKPRVLVVDDERIIADTVAAILNRSGFDAVARYGGKEAIDFLHSECPDIVLSDVLMPERNGIHVAQEARSRCTGTRIVLISGNASTPNLLEHALPDGPSFELLAKPIHPTHLLRILRG
ncbi:MAG TPA: response regulator [Terracidiphilus sp.]|jgi:CheY-like chemotaxis protein